MSTKTTFKRVALVAVAALGFGVLTSVAPATAATSDVTAVSAGTPGPARVGLSSGTTTITFAHRLQSDSYTVSAQITSAPSDSTDAALTWAQGSAANAALTVANNSGAAKTASVNTNKNVALDSTHVASIDVATTVTTGTSSLTLSLTADTAGTYQILVAVGGSATAGASAGLKSVVYSITTAGTPTSITAANYAGSVTSSGLSGQIQYFTLKDAAGNPTILGTNEAIDVTDNNANVRAEYLAGGAATSFGSATAPVGDRYYYRVVNNGTAIAAAGTVVTTFNGGLLLPTSLTTNISASLVAATASTGTVTVAPTTATTVRGAADGSSAWASGTMYAAGAVGLTFSGLTSGSTTAAVVHATEIVDGMGMTYNSSVTIASATPAATTVTATSPAVSATMTAASVTVELCTALNCSTGTTATVAFGASAARTISIIGQTSVLSAIGGSTTWNVNVKNQYGSNVAFTPISVGVTGRNTVATAVIGVTDASGNISYTHKDAGTLGTTDTISFSSGSLTPATATVTYGAVTVSKVTFTGPNTGSATPVVSPIGAGDNPNATTAAASVVVTDAAGNLLAGVPVVFTVSGTGAAITSTAVTVYTSSAGAAASTVFAWLAGTYTVTATAGGVTGTGTYIFANSTNTTARVLSATVAGGIITAKVVDRFGNPVSGVPVFASRTSGTGYFGTGVGKTTSTTGVSGTVEFTMVGGSADVLVSTLDYDAVAGTNAFGQTCALAGNLTCALGTTAAVAFTATKDGTTAVAGSNIGSSFAPAGVSAVTVSVVNTQAAQAAADKASTDAAIAALKAQLDAAAAKAAADKASTDAALAAAQAAAVEAATAAADAAAEATDAANAATDAANASAEAGDAATAAAQDAADAVAALSTQVSEMIDTLKKQITALTNLVIKIQKKVKA